MSYLSTENQTFMKKLLLAVLSTFFVSVAGFSQSHTIVSTDSLGVPLDTSSLVTIKNSLFFKKLVQGSTTSLILRGPAQSFVHFDHPVLGIREQVAIKTDKHFYIAISGAGRLYQQVAATDSLLYFKRIDGNENINYNLGAFYFTSGENIFNHGG